MTSILKSYTRVLISKTYTERERGVGEGKGGWGGSTDKSNQLTVLSVLFFRCITQTQKYNDRQRAHGSCCCFTVFSAKRPPPTSFSPVTSANVGISTQNFLTFSFNHFGVKLQVRTQYQSQIIELEPTPSLKKSSFSGQILIKLRL